MLRINLEDLRHMDVEDFKALNELKASGVPDDLIQMSIDNTIKHNKEKKDEG